MNINYKFLYIKKILNNNKKIYLNINNKKKYIKNNNKLITINNYLKKKGGSGKTSLFKNLHKKSLSSIKKDSSITQINAIEKELKKRQEKEDKKNLNDLEKKISNLNFK